MAEPDGSTDFKPYIPAETHIPEFTWSAVFAGAVLGVIFGASSIYLVLKVGMTVSASIPVAVLSITLFRWLGSAFGIRKATILENNIVQTTGSAGESIAFGVGVTMPALMLIGYEMDWLRVLVVSVLGGLLGILMMIPLRRAFIVHMHGKPGEPGKLLYPEGTACAQVLISGDKGGASGKTVFIGFGIAFAHKFLTEGINLFTATVNLPLKLGEKATDAFSRVAKLSSDMATELLGVGYIIGVRTSSIMMAGAVLGGLVIGPTIALSGDPSLDANIEDQLRRIGTGCVAAAGIISMAKTLPMIIRSFRAGLAVTRQGAGVVAEKKRTDDDMPASYVLGGTLVLLILLAAFLWQDVSHLKAILGAFLVLLFGFLFVTVSSRLTGEIGSSSNPISGMTVATLLMTCLIFLALGMTGPTEAVLALCIGGVVCIAASNGGTTSQDLKTGFLVGATPRLQQWAILVGALTSAVIIGGTLILFNSVGTVYSQRNLPEIKVKHLLESLKEKTDYQGEQFHIMTLSKDEEFSAEPQGEKTIIPAGKYFVDGDGAVVFKVDPTITGDLEFRDRFVRLDQELPGDLDPDVRKKLEEIKQAGSSTTVQAEKGKSAFKNKASIRKEAGKPLSHLTLWKNQKAKAEPNEKDAKKSLLEPSVPTLPEGEYLLDDAGNILAYNVPTKVTMKFKAPKTLVMGIIINGLLNQSLDWALVLIGVFIAVALELCEISSLAFAVGLYIPMSASAPIFMGGMVRWLVEATTRRPTASPDPADKAALAEAEVKHLAQSESSPAMLLASGFIAGGSLAAVLIAFMNFLPQKWQDSLNLKKWVEGVYAIGGVPAFVPQLLALVLFLVLAVILYLVGKGLLFKVPEESAPPVPPLVPRS